VPPTFRALLLTPLLLGGCLFAQQPPPRRIYLRQAVVHHWVNSAIVIANDPRPLRQAIIALRNEYGWIVDYEDPPYFSDFDLFDSTAPKWRADHPTERGARSVGGGFFQSEYPETPDASSSPFEEEAILNKVVADYNNSGNPGKFRLLKEAPGRFSVVGESVKDDKGRDVQVPSLLDTVVFVPEGERIPYESVRAILDALSARTGVKCFYNTFGNDTLGLIRIPSGGHTSARSLLLAVFKATSRPFSMDWFYITDANEYALSLRLPWSPQ